MAWIQRIGNGYRIAWRDGGRGSPIRTGPVHATKAAASEHMRSFARGQALRKGVPRGVCLGIDEVLDRWLASRAVNRHASDLYIEKSRLSLRRLIDKRGWRTTADVSAESLHDVGIGSLRLIRALLRYAEGLDQLVDRRALNVRPPPRPETPEVELLTNDEVQRLIDRAGEWSRSGAVLAHMLSTYGHRPETLAKARVGDVDLRSGDISLDVKSIGRNRRIRHRLLKTTLDQVREIVAGRAADEALFLNHAGKPWKTGQAMAQWWYDSVGAEVLGRGDRRCGIYQLKCYAISRMLSLGLDVKTIASITGHKSPGTLMRYARTNRQRQDAVIEVLERIS